MDQFDNSVKAALHAMDDNRSGRVSLQEWVDCMGEMNYPHSEEAALAFAFMDTDQTGIVGAKEFRHLQELNVNDFLKDMSEFVGFFQEKLHIPGSEEKRSLGEIWEVI
jgi:Ca2+-binding EF-hand superfamily protein